MILRPATPADYPAIVVLIPDEQTLFWVYPKGRFPFDVAQLEALAQSRQALTVVEHKGEVVGFANLYDVTDGKAFIGNVVVAETLRGQGVGRRLIEAMMLQARDDFGAQMLHISVFADNAPALALYRHLGFERYEAAERTDPKGNQVVLLHLKRTAPE